MTREYTLECLILGELERRVVDGVAVGASYDIGPAVGARHGVVQRALKKMAGDGVIERVPGPKCLPSAYRILRPELVSRAPVLVQWTDERIELLRDRYALTHVPAMTALLNALPGAHLTEDRVMQMATRQKLKHSAEFWSDHRKFAADRMRRKPYTRSSDVASKPHVKRTSQNPVAIDFARKPAVKVIRGNEAEAIAEFIARNGVTRCPPVALEPTQAVIPPEARAVLTEYQARQQEMRDAAVRPRLRAAGKASARSAFLAGSVG